MSLQFVLGGSGSGKSTYVFDKIIERSIVEENKNFLILVPDQFTMQTQMELVNRHPRGGILNIDVLSFSRLSHRILEETGGNIGTVLDDTGKSLVLRKVAEELKEEIPVLGSNLKKLGYIHEVKSAISRFTFFACYIAWNTIRINAQFIGIFFCIQTSTAAFCFCY